MKNKQSISELKNTQLQGSSDEAAVLSNQESLSVGLSDSEPYIKNDISVINILQSYSQGDLSIFYSFYNEVLKLCKPNQYNLLLHKHLGDIFYAAATKEEFEQTHKAQLHFIVRPQHEFVMKMHGITNYSLCDITKYEKQIAQYNFPFLVPLAVNKTHYFETACKDLFQSFPIKDLPFIADADRSVLILFDNFWAFFWPHNLGLDIDNFRYHLPAYNPALSESAKNKLADIAPLEKIVLFAPDALSTVEFAPEFWNILAEAVNRHGYKIIVNSKKYKIKHGISAFDLDLSLQDVVALGLSCAYVFSLRSGLCDVLVGAGERLYAFYSAMLRREMHSLNSCFEQSPNVNEIAVWDWKIDKVVWEGEDLTKPLQKHINKLHRDFIIEKVKYLCALPSRSRRNAHKFWYRVIRDTAGNTKWFPNNNKENILPKYRDKKNIFFGIADLFQRI